MPSHVAADAPVGLGHDAQVEVPHELTLVSGAQSPAQSCVPDGHMPEQDDAIGMQAPAQSFMVAGQVGVQLVPSQVAEPPLGAWQGIHDVGPHELTLALLTQTVPHRWKPGLHAMPH